MRTIIGIIKLATAAAIAIPLVFIGITGLTLFLIAFLLIATLEAMYE